MKGESHSCRDILWLLGAAPIVAGAVADVQGQPPPALAQAPEELGAQAPRRGGRGGGGFRRQRFLARTEAIVVCGGHSDRLHA